jgi:hypothetical protein
MKYGTATDAMRILNMNAKEIRAQYLEFQKQLYIA